MKKVEIAYIFIVISAIVGYLFFTFPDFYPFPETTAFLTMKMINIFDYSAVNYKHNILINGYDPIAVSAECSGIIILVAFVLTIQVMPMLTIFQKVTAILISPIIYLGNLIRIFMSLMAGLKGNVSVMMFVHDTVGQIFLFFWAITIYLIWLKAHSLFPRDTYTNSMHHRWHHRTVRKK